MLSHGALPFSVVLGEVPQDSKEWAHSEGSAELDERSGEESEEEGRSRHDHRSQIFWVSAPACL